MGKRAEYEAGAVAAGRDYVDNCLLLFGPNVNLDKAAMYGELVASTRLGGGDVRREIAWDRLLPSFKERLVQIVQDAINQRVAEVKAKRSASC